MYFFFDFFCGFWVIFQLGSCICFILIDFFIFVVVLCVCFFDQFFFYVQVNQFVVEVDIFVVEDLEFSLFKWCSDFVFYYFYVGFVIYYVFVFFYCVDMMDVEMNRGVEFQCVIIGSGFWVIEYYINFYMDLVDEDQQCVGLFQVICQFMYCLVYYMCCKVYVRVVDFVFDFCFWCQCRYGVNDDNVYCVRMCQGVIDFQCLFVGVWLGVQQVIDIDVQFMCVDWVQCVFSIDKCIGFIFMLCCGDYLQRQRGFIGRFWFVDFDDMVYWQIICFKCDIQ